MSETNTRVIEHLRDIKSGMAKEPERVEELVVGGKRFKNKQPHMRFGDRVRLLETK